MSNRRLAVFAAFLVWCFLPSAGRAQNDAEPKALIDLLVPRQRIDIAHMGVNSFANDPQFGTVSAQLREVRSRLGIKYVRVLFSWSNEVQPSESAAPNYAFYDDIAGNIPGGVEALVVLTGLPDWVRSRPDARSLFIERWLKPTVSRYSRHGRIRAFQVWNEPNDRANIENQAIGVLEPQGYLSFVEEGSTAIRLLAPGKLVVNAATTSIAQNYPNTLRYNNSLLEGGIDSFIDRYAIHFYGTGYQYLYVNGGVVDVLKKSKTPIWVTESGRQGANRQRQYVARTWPLLERQIPNIQRFYYYQHTEGTPCVSSYGLRCSGGTSDLYRYLVSRRGRG